MIDGHFDFWQRPFLDLLKMDGIISRKGNWTMNVTRLKVFVRLRLVLDQTSKMFQICFKYYPRPCENFLNSIGLWFLICFSDYIDAERVISSDVLIDRYFNHTVLILILIQCSIIWNFKFPQKFPKQLKYKKNNWVKFRPIYPI